MDKKIDSSKRFQKKRKKILSYLFIALCIVAVIIGLNYFLKPSVKQNEIVTSKVKRGTIQNTLSAQGKVESFDEVLVVSPISSSIDKVFAEIGSELEEGYPIIQLNTDLLQMQYQQLNEELQLKNNNVGKLQLELNRNLRQIEIQNKIKALEVKNKQANVDRMQRLYDIGGETREALERSQQELQIAKYEKQKLENEMKFQKASFGKDMANENILSSLQRQRLQEIGLKIKNSEVRSPAKGVLTWVENRIGMQVQEGETIAKISNIKALNLIGSISERQSDKLKVGQTALVTTGKTVIKGKVEQIYPTVENNTVKFKISVAPEMASLLKPNQELAVSVITGEKTDVLYVLDGPVFKGTPSLSVFKVNGNIAEQQEINVGLQSGGKVEILTGLQEGDEIIISDMKEYEGKSKIELE